MKTLRLLPLTMAALLLAGCSSGFRKGDRFETAAQFEGSASTFGLVILGQFDVEWPATVVSVTYGQGKVEIDIPGETKHLYEGFDGYALEGLVLQKEAGGFSGIVLRTAEKID